MKRKEKQKSSPTEKPILRMRKSVKVELKSNGTLFQVLMTEK